MIKLDCAICKDKQKLVRQYPENFDAKKIDSATFSARRTPGKTHYQMMKCLRCGLVFSSPIFEEKKILNFYRKSEFNYLTMVGYLKKTYGEYLKLVLPEKKIEEVSLLEIGCGNGFFLEEAIRLGVKNVFGVEPSVKAINEAPDIVREKIKEGPFKAGLYKGKQFDLICCFHTLDHVKDPDNFIKLSFKLLKKGGKVLFIVHDTEGLSVKLFGEGSAIFDIEHIYLFNKFNLKKIFEQNGFKNIHIFDVSNNYPLNYWFRMVPFPALLKKLMLNIMNISKIGFLPIKIKAGNIGIIARKI